MCLFVCWVSVIIVYATYDIDTLYYQLVLLTQNLFYFALFALVLAEGYFNLAGLAYSVFVTLTLSPFTIFHLFMSRLSFRALPLCFRTIAPFIILVKYGSFCSQ